MVLIKSTPHEILTQQENNYLCHVIHVSLLYQHSYYI